MTGLKGVERRVPPRDDETELLESAIATSDRVVPADRAVLMDKEELEISMVQSVAFIGAGRFARILLEG